MKNHVLPSLVFVFFFGFATAAWADYTFEGGVLTVNGETDLAGGSLTFEELSSMTGTGSFTDSVGGGVLTLGVAEGETVWNGSTDDCKVGFKGALKLVKRGKGVFSISGTKTDTHTFTGGIDVLEGELRSDKTKNSALLAGAATPFGKDSTINVAKGAVLEVNGYYGLSGLVINLSGGTLRNAKTLSDPTKAFEAAISLSDDSMFLVNAGDGYNYQGKLNLNGHTLTLKTKTLLSIHPTIAAGAAGRLVAEREGSTAVKNAKLAFIAKGEERTVDLSNVDFETSIKMNVAVDVDVKDYVSENTLANEATNEGSGVLRVHGTFVPNTENYYPVSLVDGAAIDLSGKTAPWTMNSVTIPEGAGITVKIGRRQVTDGETLIVWPAEGAVGSADSFSVVGTGGASDDFEAVWSKAGLAVKIADTKVVAAVWTGDANDGDPANSANWACTNKNGDAVENGLPSLSSAISIPYAKLSSVSWPASAAEAYGVPRLTGESPSGAQILAADRDWTGLGAMDFPFSMDLAGYELKIQLPNIGKNETSAEQSMTSSLAGGRLCVSIAEGDVYKNTTVTLAGSLTLVKDGPGEFDATVLGQTYDGGTEVKGGTLSVTMIKQMFGDAGTRPLGATGSAITVGAGGILDVNNKYKFAEAGYSIVLNGGQLCNEGTRTGAITSFPLNPAVVLESDSTFLNVNTNNFAGSLKLNGHVLATTIGANGNLRWAAEPVSPGTLAFAGEGQAILTVEKGIEMRATNLRMAAPMTIAEGQTLTVGDYVVDYEGAANVAAGELAVTGNLKPNGAGLYPCTLANGSAIDLCEKKGAWSLPSDVSFAENATIRILVREPETGFRAQVRVVSWTDSPTTTGLKFVLDDALQTKGYGLTRDANGLWVGRKGFVVVFE